MAWNDTQVDEDTDYPITAEKWNNMVDDQESRAKVSSGAGAPSSTPTMIGAIYFDTTNLKFYLAAGTSSSSDWKKVITQ